MLTALLVTVSLIPLPQDPETLKQIRAAVDEASNPVDAPAILIAVAREKRTVLADVRGKVDKQAVANTALFPMGEASKILSGLLFDRLGQAGKLDPDAKLSAITDEWILRDRAGKATAFTLAELLRGRAGLPQHTNFLRPEEVKTWTLQRALAEHAIASGRRSWASDLDFGVAQRVVERAQKRPWTALVRAEWMQPLGITDLEPDASSDFPAEAVPLFQSGSLFRRTQPETRFVSPIAAAQGAWIGAKGLGRLLRELLRSAKNRPVRALPKEKLAFAAMDTGNDPFPHVSMRFSSPGMRGEVAVFPEQDIAWGVIVNAAHSGSGMPALIRSTLEQLLLPKSETEESTDRWNTTVGTAGKPMPLFKEPHRGEWVGTYRLHGKERTVRLWIGERTPTHVQFPGEEKVAANGFHYRQRSDGNFGIWGKTAVPIRKDLGPGRFRMDLDHSEEREGLIRGTFEVTKSPYLRLTFPIEFKKVER